MHRDNRQKLSVSRRAAAAAAMLLAWCTARPEIAVEAGTNFVMGDHTESVMVLVQKRWRGKWGLGLGFMSQQCLDNEVKNIDCDWDIDSQFFVGGERRFSWRRWTFSLGLHVVDQRSRISSGHLNARSSLEFAVTDKLAVKFAHLSNGGTGSTMTACNSRGWCTTRKFNLGINTLALVWQF